MTDDTLLPIYLAGPISGRSDADATDWRARAVALIAGAVPTLDPMRRDYRGREHLPGVDAEIVLGDKEDIRSCSAIVLRWDGAGSAGTTMELLYAFEQGVPAHVWDDRPLDQRHRPLSPWVTYHAATIRPSLEEAVAVALAGWLRR